MLATNLGGKVVHVPGNLLVGDASIDLGGLDVGVAEHLRDALDGHSVFEGDGSGEGIPFLPPSGISSGCALRHPLARSPAKHRMQLSALRANWPFSSSTPYGSKLSTG